MPKNRKDNLFANNFKVKDFKFNKKVADVFDEMLERSVPFYDELQRMVGELTLEFAKDGTNIYDLGCATGNTMYYLAGKLKKRDVKIIGLDNSESMLAHAKARLASGRLLGKCEFKIADLNQNIHLNNPSVVISILTLQFIRPLQRETLINHIYNRLHKNAAFIVVEKVLGSDSITNRMYIDLYYEFKKRNGYSELEISKKREALENVLIPYTVDENKMLLRRNGFKVVDTFFNWYNFCGFLAIKT